MLDPELKLELALPKHTGLLLWDEGSGSTAATASTAAAAAVALCAASSAAYSACHCRHTLDGVAVAVQTTRCRPSALKLAPISLGGSEGRGVGSTERGWREHECVLPSPLQWMRG